MTDVCVKCGQPAGVTLERGEHNQIKTVVCLNCLRAGWNWQAFFNREKKKGQAEPGQQIDVLG